MVCLGLPKHFPLILLESSKPLPVGGYQVLRIPLVLGRDPELAFQCLFTLWTV